MEEKENNVQNFLLGIRDNLLKPMAADINSNTDVCGKKMLQYQKRNSIFLWILLTVTVLNFAGIITILILK